MDIVKRLSRDNIKPTWKYAFKYTFIIGFLVHFFKFTNNLLCHDSLHNFYSIKDKYSVGRWFLTVPCSISSYFNLPWLTGLLSIVYISLTAVIIVDIFDLKDKLYILLTGGLLAAFPAVTATFIYQFTADGYFFAMLLAALAVRITVADELSWKRGAAAAALICLSAAIYQAYLSFAIVLMLCYFLRQLLSSKLSVRRGLRWIGMQGAIYIVGLASYYGIWRIILMIHNTGARDYKGINDIGSFGIANIVYGIKHSIFSIAYIFFEHNVFEKGWTPYSVLNLVFLILTAAAVVLAVIRSGIYKDVPKFLLFLGCMILLPFAVCIWSFVSSSVSYTLLMLQSAAIIYIFALTLYKDYFSGKIRSVALLLIAVIIFNFAAQANICYYFMDKCYEASYATGIEMISRIHELDDGSVENITFVGKHSSVEGSERIHRDAIPMFTSLIPTNLLYDNRHAGLFLRVVFDCDIPCVKPGIITDEASLEQIEQMPVWPAPGSAAVFDSTIVIKLS